MPLTNDKLIYLTNSIQMSVGSSYQLCNAGIDDEDIDKIIELMNSNPKIKILLLNSNNIQDQGAKALTRLQYIDVLEVEQNNFGDKAAEALVKDSRFSSLDMSRNRGITDKAGYFILEFLAEDKRLITLDIKETQINPKLQKEISLNIQKNLELYRKNKKKPTTKPLISSSRDSLFSNSTSSNQSSSPSSRRKSPQSPSSLASHQAK